MKEIYLANDKGIILVDDENYEWLNQYKWYLHSNGYALTSIKINKKYKIKRMHRLLMNEPAGFDIDHIDHNKLNNQKNNLRIVTRSQNQMNRQKRENCSSKFKGVCFFKRDKKWSAEIRKNGIKIYLGYFKNEEDAAIAYNKKAKELFGEHAYLNEVKP